MIPVNRPLLNGNEKKYLCECIDGGWISSEGPFVRQLEEHFESYTGRQHGVAVCNGSAALELAFSALDLEPGDEVILPSFTIISCFQAILRAGAIPVPVDCDAATWNVTADHIRASITSKTRAILIVHIYGLACDVGPILDLAREQNLYVIEDAAEAHGARWRGKLCGGFGDISTFSFYPNKLVTTGEGGMVLTDSNQLAAKLRSRRNLAFSAKRRFVHDELGWNMRMSNLQAAVGCAQFERLNEFIARKRQVGQKYISLLRSAPGILLPCPQTSYSENLYWVFGVVLDSDFPISADVFMSKLSAAGVGTRPFFWPIHKQPVARTLGLYNGLSLPVSEHLGKNGFYIPSGLGTTDEEVEKSAQALLDIIGAL